MDLSRGMEMAFPGGWVRDGGKPLGRASARGLVCCLCVCGGLMQPTQGRGLEWHPEGEQRGIFANAGLQARLLHSPVH